MRNFELLLGPLHLFLRGNLQESEQEGPTIDQGDKHEHSQDRRPRHGNDEATDHAGNYRNRH